MIDWTSPNYDTFLKWIKGNDICMVICSYKNKKEYIANKTNMRHFQ